MNFAVEVSRSVCRLVSMGLVLGCAASVAAAATEAEMNADRVVVLHRDLARAFVLDKKLRIDPALRTAANEMSAAHLARMDKLLLSWLQEERGLNIKGRAPNEGEVYFAVTARVQNELALWHIAPGDADYESATLAVLQSSPRICDREGNSRFSDFSSRMLRVQAMPAAQRTAALAAERKLLAQWGQAHTAVAPWPDPLPQDAAVALLKRPHSERPALAASPLLASALIAEKKDYADIHPDAQCALQQWWLRESLRQGATPAAALNAFRYGTLITTSVRYAGFFEDPYPDAKPGTEPAVPRYPLVALHFGARGSTVVQVQPDAAGKPLQASVVARKIIVPGIRGVRPVAFEDAFDPSSVTYAMEGKGYPKPVGTAPVRFEMVWTLPDRDATPANTPTGASQ